MTTKNNNQANEEQRRTFERILGKVDHVDWATDRYVIYSERENQFVVVALHHFASKGVFTLFQSDPKPETIVPVWPLPALTVASMRIMLKQFIDDLKKRGVHVSKL